MAARKKTVQSKTHSKSKQKKEEIPTIKVMIEIPKGSRNKYEYDKEANVIKKE